MLCILDQKCFVISTILYLIIAEIFNLKITSAIVRNKTILVKAAKSRSFFDYRYMDIKFVSYNVTE